MPRLSVRPVATEADRAAALEVWAAARHARDRAPGIGRRERIARSMASSPVALLAEYGEEPAGVALAEHYRDEDGTDTARGHVALLAVVPARWGNGIGSALVQALQQPPEGTAWTALSVWTRTSNSRGQRLCHSCGFVDTGERAHLREGEEILRLSWAAD